jgi:3-methyladenine DNA glycosylase/8-oxoguanine DNA glycosylase
VLVPLPQPYDFELSTSRFDLYGRDAATLWHDGGLHRVFAGREVRLEAAPGGVDVHPHDGAIEADVLRFLGLPFELEPFRAWAEADPVLGRLALGLAGYRPVLQPDPFEALVTSITAQQVSLQSAAAIRSRFVERYGTPYEYAHAFPERERIAEATEGELFGLGFSNRKAEYVIALARTDLDLDELSELPDETGFSHATSGAPTPGRPATWDCGRRWLRSMVTCPIFVPSPSASTPTRTSAPTTS